MPCHSSDICTFLASWVFVPSYDFHLAAQVQIGKTGQNQLETSDGEILHESGSEQETYHLVAEIAVDQRKARHGPLTQIVALHLQGKALAGKNVAIGRSKAEGKPVEIDFLVMSASLQMTSAFQS